VVWVEPVVGLDDAACLMVAREVDGPPWTTHRALLNRALTVVAVALQRQHTDRALRVAATSDPLTGLANRATFFRALGQALVTARSPLAVLCVDLDGFKPVNDTLGHAAGDDVLRIVAERLRDACRPHDTVSRIGGDEFAVLCEGVSRILGAEQIADRFLEAMRQPFHGLALAPVGASIGVLFVDLSSTDRDPDQIVERADALMYQAKREGGWRQCSAILDS
jgi:diguanylate cyclase (GGDEF)-like protein